MRDVNLLKSNGVDVDKSINDIFGDIEMYDDTMNDFLNEIGTKVADIKKYKEASDMANYAIQVHSLKSDARYLGFTKLADMAYEHELKSKANDSTFVFDNYDALMTETNRIVDLCKAYVGRPEIKPVIENNVVKSNKAILVVDDSNLVTNYIKKIFDEQYDVISATDGQKAIDAINNDHDNMIIGMLLDLNMPGVDGFTVLEYLKSHSLFSKVPVAIVTGGDDKVTVSKAFTYPIIDLLAKPFNERDVKRVVDKMINHY